MSLGVQRLLENQAVGIDFSVEGLSAEYMLVLNHFWNGRFTEAAHQASALLAQDDDHPATARLYRAWIESLAELEDQDSLVAMSDHLLVLGRTDDLMKQTFLALRGVIHLHLDQVPAARLVLRAIQGRDTNPYCLEFEQMCARRGFEHASEFSLLQSRVPMNDWFHWNTLVGDLSLSGTPDDLHEVLNYVHRSFPGCPTLDAANFHRAVDFGYWPGALASATKLHANFPEHEDYGFMTAFSAYRSGDQDLALKTLRGLGETLNQADPDVLCLTGEILANQAIDADSEPLARTALEKLRLSAKLYKREGKPVDHALSLIQRLERQLVGDASTTNGVDAFRAPRSWMIMLNPSQYASLATSGDQDIGVLHRPMGKEAMPGDIVLFVTKSAHVAKQPAPASQEWRIVAVYRVSSAPYWHPTNRWQNSLELVDRPDAPIPIDAKEVNSDLNVRGKSYSLPRGHHARYGVYELDDSAMDIVVAAVKRRSDGVAHDVERRQAQQTKKDSV